MLDYFSSAAAQLGVSAWLIVLIVVWEAVWTAIAMWQTSKMGHLFWFVIFFLINLFGIPEIIYLLVVSKKKSSSQRRSARRRKRR